MSWIRFFRRRRWDEERARELEAYLEIETDENMAGGMSPEEARYAAQRKLGNTTLIREEIYHMNSLGWLENVWQDLGYGLRQFRRSPGFTAVAVLTLALGIGANTAIFTVIDAVLLRPLPYPDPGRVVWVTEFMPQSGRDTVLTPEYAAWEKEEKVFDRFGAFSLTRGANLTGGAHPERILAGHVTQSFFPVLGIEPALGRAFLPGEERPGHDHVAVLSHDLWQSYFNRNPNILGKSLVLDGASYSVIGVMPRRFLHPGSAGVGVWLPDALPPGSERPGMAMGIVSVIGRLKPDVSPGEAQAALEVVTRRMDNQYPPPWSRYHAAAHARVIPLHSWLTRDVRPALFVMLGAVGLVLLIACANVANLLLARAVSREKEIAIRAAIGAGRSRLVRQMLTESTLLAVCGSGLGLLLVPLLTTILQSFVPESLPGHLDLDSRVLGLTLACALATGILFGLAPVFAALKLRLTDTLKESTSHFGESKTHRRLRSGLVVAQLGLSLVLLVGAGLLVRSFLLLLKVNSGIDPHNVLTAEVWLTPENIYNPPRQREFFQQVLERVRMIPGVEFAGATTEVPFTMFNSLGNGLRAEGQPEPGIDLTYCPATVTPNYFRAMGVRLLSGRFFDERDAEGAPPVVILDQSLARALFPKQNAVGKRIRANDSVQTVVGVVTDTHHLGLSESVTPELYSSYLQGPSSFMDIVVRTSSDPLSYVPALRNAVLAVDKSLPLANVKTMEQRVGESLSTRRERLLLLGAFAMLAVLIAASGVYGVTAYSVTRRTHEIGVRLAMGAQPRDVMRMIIAQGLRTILSGIGVGFGGALAMSRALTSFLYNIPASDPLTFGVVSSLLGGIAWLALYIPARRATKVDPMVALRYE
ncbi:MAG TPA: ABC transporter permease [Terriglobia bacterium]|nr:ABC transporter permease [Terriglobia bacterium]